MSAGPVVAPAGRRLPLSDAQAAVWYAQRIDCTDPTFVVAEYADLEGSLDPELVARAVARVVTEAPQLCAVVDPGPDGTAPEQVLPVEPTADVAVHDLRPEADPEAAARGWMASDLRRPTDLESGPMLESALLRLTDRRWFWYLRAHHLTLDGYGFALLWRRLAEVVAALHDGAEPGPGRFADLEALLVEDAARRAGGDREADGDWWRAHFADRPVPTVLGTRPEPDDGPEPPHHARAGLGSTVLADIDALAGDRGVTRAEVLVAAIGAFVRRATPPGADGATVLGVPVMGRSRPVGLRVPTTTASILPLRLAPADDDEVARVVDDAAAAFGDLRAHQGHRGEDLRRDLGLVGRDQRLTGPVVNLKPDPPYLRLGVASGPVHAIATGPVDDVAITPVGEELLLTGSARRWTAADLDALAARLAGFVAAFASDASATLGSLEVATPAERARAVTPPEPHDGSWPATLPEVFARGAAIEPGATALVDPSGAGLTYAELDAESARLARTLIADGVGPGDIVALALGQRPMFVVAVLAVLRAGATYLPLETGHPAERLAATLADAAPALVLTTGDQTLPGDVRVRRLDDPADRARVEAASPGPLTDNDRLRPPDPDDGAHLIYTSGSTGRPKGVLVPHRAVVDLLASTSAGFRFGPDDVWTWFHSGAFDFSVWELWGPLAHGARLVVVPPPVARSPRELLDLLVAQRVTVLNQTPSAFGQLAAADAERPEVGDRLALRLVIFGGEALQPVRLQGWAARHDPAAVALVNMYGITETTVHVTWHRLDAADLRRGDGVIGRPLPGRSIRLLDRAGRLVPPGAVGEIHVAGEGLARGYRGRPELTAAAFRPDPFGPPGSRMYRSGDLARRQPDGTFVHLGRSDDQVQLRGYRIEPGEVVAALLALPGVTDAAVVLREDRADDPRLVGYVMGADPDPSSLRRALADVLPAHQVPSAIVVLDALPVTANGKLDRAVLPAPDLDTADDGGGSPVAQVIAGLFAEILGLVRPPGRDADFFALGGHSLLAMRLIARVRSVLGAELDIRTVFTTPTPAAIATALDGAARPALTRRPAGSDPGLSPAQRRMWFRQQVDGPVPTYNLPWALGLRGPLDVAALGEAVSDVVARHESLRTVFPARRGEPGHRVLDQVPPMAITPVTAEELSAAVAAAARRGIDLAHEPPLRAELFTVTDDHAVLLLVAHHIASDDSSMRPLAADLGTAYRARCDGAPGLPPLPVQYRDYTAWQGELLGDPDDEGSRLGRGLEFWTAALDGLGDRIELPTDHPRPPTASGRGEHVRIELDPELHTALRTLARRHGVSLFMVLHAALATVLHRLGAGDDIAVGTPVAGRTDEALDELVGFFVNTLVLRTDLSGAPSFAALLERVRDVDLAAFAHQDVPFDHVVEAINPPRALDRHPLFQVMLSLGSGAPEVALPGLTVRPETVPTGTAKFDLTASLAPRDGALVGYLEYATDLFEPAGATAIADRFKRVLRAVAADPDVAIEAVDVLGADERRMLVHEWNDTDAPVPPDSVVDMIAAATRLDPDAPAVVYEGLTLSYRELDVRSNRLAHRLAGLGVGPERTVGIHLERGVELVVGLVAVLKAGAAFVPLDQDWPAARTAEVAHAARLRAVLSHPDPSRPDGPTGDPAIAVVDPLDPTLDDEPITPLDVVIDPDSLAYVIYTSGSTGTPKGAMIRHEAVSNRLPWQVGLLELGPDDGVLFKAPLTFDISVNEVLLPLVVGARLVVAVPGGERDVSYLLDLVAAQRVTFVYLVSTMLDLMLEHDDVGVRARSLRHVWCGGEVLTPELHRRFTDRLGASEATGRVSGATMYHGYGPAEATIGVTCQVYRGEHGGGITIGRPNPNARVHVLDAAMNPVPVGVPGELYLGGVPLGRGYLDDPVRTADRFVPDPVSGRPGERLYATGDLARLRPDGNVEFLGRVDNQVKIRGMRVELEEIEAVLGRDDAVRQAVVLLAADGGSLRAFVTSGEATADTTALLDWVADRLPAHMVPDRITAVPRFPLMPSGKVDRKALARIPTEEAGRERAPVESPGNGLERTVAAVWEDVLGVTGIGAGDNFFDLGGHSLLLARVQTRLQREIGHAVPVLDLFSHATVRDLATYLAAETTGGGTEALGMLLPLRPIDAATQAAPVFCFHPASGLSWPFAGLRKHLGEDVPLYGVQARGLDGSGDGSVPSSIEEMALEYLAAIRTVAPHGPYRFVGWSFGGVVAHTLATLLQEQGEQVELLAMLDSYPAYPWDRLADDHEQQALRSLLYMSHYDLETLPPGPLDRATVSALVAEHGGVLAELPDASIGQVMSTFVNSAVLQQRIAHRRFAGDVLFFTATVNPIDPGLSHADWAPYVDGTVRNHDVACEHKDMTQAGPLAVIGRLLAAAIPATSSTPNPTRQETS
ncbi:amino acid adenylation domain-containing protein [Actinomycetospora endophytica]|uniref:Amino acid adenylation domain-containing protein n=1 Tax=Actinomycetospora endophytica TaxID=2291215 RepID=A0ABS8PH54_9PSEU|nr:non-ribosomal peptide synthetase [Actinomycetospora endophytica]MCD2197596.1 amino acid adenylation domain-containing protein [Actinomycetospora endophytica]